MLTFCSGGIPPDGYLHSIDLRNWKLSGEGRLQLHAFTSQRKSLTTLKYNFYMDSYSSVSDMPSAD